MQPEPANISTHWVLAAVYSESLKMPIMHLIWASLSPSLSVCQIYWMPRVKLWFLSALCRETDWAPRCLATGWNAKDQFFMGRDADPWEMFFLFFFNLMSCQNINLWPQQLINVQTKTFECVSSQIPTGVECCGEGAGYKSTEISRVLDFSDKTLISTADVCLCVFLVSERCDVACRSCRWCSNIIKLHRLVLCAVK